MTGRRTLEYPSTPSGEIPDHLRCRKNDGKQWRCPMPSLPNITICHYHNEQQRRNYHNRQKNQKSHPTNNPHVAIDDDDDDVVLALAAKEGDDEMRELPNGVMTISPAPARVFDRSVVDRKVGAEERVVWGRSVRSKNVEPVPVGPVKRFPIGDKSLVKRKRWRRSCHQCGEKNVTKADRCRKCKNVYFCSGCLSKWYRRISESEEKSACPVCCGFCNCETCLLAGAKDRSSKDTCCTEDTVNKMQRPDIPVPQQLSEEEQIIQNELNELELEALDQGRRSSCIQLQVAERAIVNCNYCKTLLAGFHRSCSICSYKLCLDCSGKLRNGHIPVLVENGKSSKATQAYKNYGKETGAKQDDTSRSSITCPTKKLGGCGDGLLRLMFMMPFGRSTELNYREEGFV